jgi:hypothetical protein
MLNVMAMPTRQPMMQETVSMSTVQGQRSMLMTKRTILDRRGLPCLQAFLSPLLLPLRTSKPVAVRLPSQSTFDETLLQQRK